MCPGWTWPLTKPIGPVDAAVMSVSLWSVAERNPALLEVQSKESTRGGAGWRMEVWQTSTSADQDPSDSGRGILPAWAAGVGERHGLILLWTAWNWGRSTVDRLPTISARPFPVAEGPGGGAGCTKVRLVTVMGRHHAQATARPTKEEYRDSWKAASWA